jgi:post-segregation antitoxin (ccd killing protein)
MPKVSIYLSDELYRQAQEHELPLSALAQEAVVAALRRRHNAEWIEAVRARDRRVTERIDTSGLMDEVREEFGR